MIRSCDGHFHSSCQRRATYRNRISKPHATQRPQRQKGASQITVKDNRRRTLAQSGQQQEQEQDREHKYFPWYVSLQRLRPLKPTSLRAWPSQGCCIFSGQVEFWRRVSWICSLGAGTRHGESGVEEDEIHTGEGICDSSICFLGSRFLLQPISQKNGMERGAESISCLFWNIAYVRGSLINIYWGFVVSMGNSWGGTPRRFYSSGHFPRAGLVKVGGSLSRELSTSIWGRLSLREFLGWIRCDSKPESWWRVSNCGVAASTTACTKSAYIPALRGPSVYRSPIFHISFSHVWSLVAFLQL